MKTKYVYLVLLALVSLLLVSCGSKKRYSQEEIKTALGIVKGQTNEVRIGGVLYRIPGNYTLEHIEIEADKMRAGAYEETVWQVLFHLDLSSWLDPQPVSPSEESGLIRVKISSKAFEYPARRDQEFENRNWASRRDIPEWNLREYISKEFPERGGWGVLSYRALGMSTPRGGPVLYSCETNYLASKQNVAKAGLCASFYQTLEGPGVSYFMTGKFLPRWQAVHTEVQKLVKSLVVAK